MKIRNKITGMVLLLVVFAMLLLVILPPGFRYLRRRQTKTVTAFDTLAAYPFAESESTAAEQNTTTSSLLETLSDRIADLEKDIKERCTDTFYLQLPCAIVVKWVDKALGGSDTLPISSENDPNTAEDVVTLFQEDYLGFVVDDVDISPQLDRLVTFGKQLEAEGRNFLFFMSPGKYAGNETYTDYSAEKQEQVFQALEENGLDGYDVSKTIAQQGLDFKSLFFKTDHHWLPSTGIWADQLLSEYLNQNYGYSIDTSIFDPENYETTVLEKHFLGSQGKKVTTAYCELEDFPIITPKYDTNLEVFVSGTNATAVGSVPETLFKYAAMDEQNPYFRNDYALYGYGDQALITIHNQNVQDGSKILAIKSSFADCMIPYLATAVENLDVIDLRKFEGSLQTYIHETNPDTVIMIYGVTAFVTEETGGGLFDFR